MRAITATFEENARSQADEWVKGLSGTEKGTETRPSGLISIPGFDRTREEAEKLAMQMSAGSPTLSAYIVGFTDKTSEKAIELEGRIADAEKDAADYEENLTIGFMRNGWKSVTCPTCKSSISLAYGRHFKVCPICGEKKIIAPKYIETLEGKKRKVLALKSKLADLPAGENAIRRYAAAWSYNG